MGCKLSRGRERTSTLAAMRDVAAELLGLNRNAIELKAEMMSMNSELLHLVHDHLKGIMETLHLLDNLKDYLTKAPTYPSMGHPCSMRYIYNGPNPFSNTAHFITSPWTYTFLFFFFNKINITLI